MESLLKWNKYFINFKIKSWYSSYGNLYLKLNQYFSEIHFNPKSKISTAPLEEIEALFLSIMPFFAA